MSSSTKPKLARNGIPLALCVAFFILFEDKKMLFPLPTDADISSCCSKTNQLEYNDHCPLDSIAKAFLSTNSSQYNWMGNHFIPPPNIPIFRPEEYISHFGSRNTLFIGDSTMRRAYGTFHAIMTGKDPTDLTMKELSNQQTIDFGKPGRRRREPCRVLIGHGVDLPGANSGFDCRHVVVENDDCDKGMVNANATELCNENMVIFLKEREFYYDDSTKGKYDFLGMPCISNILNEFFPEKIHTDIQGTANGAEKQQLFRHYDTIIVGIGLWEALRPSDCNIPTIPDTSKRIELLLESMEQISSKDQQIVFRTPGFHKTHDGDKTVWNVLQGIKNYGHGRSSNNTGQNDLTDANIIESKSANKETDTTTQYSGQISLSHSNVTTKTTTTTTAINNIAKYRNNITIVDFGTVISKRSFGDDRILGDLSAHYGVEARLLFGQQLLHELRSAELRRGILLYE